MSYNHTGIDDFDGLSPYEMQLILYDSLKDGSIIELNVMDGSDYDKVPIIRLTRLIANAIVTENSEIKLTATGNLPPKIVKDIYRTSNFPDDEIEDGIIKVSKETDVKSITQTRIIMDLAGITKVRNKKLSLTKNGLKIINEDSELLSLLFETFGQKANWCYFDRYPENEAGRLGFVFTIILLGKYGNTSRTDRFYSDKYYKAFPFIVDQFSDRTIRSKEESAHHCYSLRSFDRFLKYFGIIDIDERFALNDKQIKTNELFKKMIKIKIGT